MNGRALVTAAAALALVGALAGCASSADRSGMVAADVAVQTKHDRSVAVNTAGGAATGAMDSSNIEDADFKAAIEESIVANQVFKRVVAGKNADYELLVTIVSLDKPLMGLDMTVNLEATWVLVRQSDRSVALKKSIQTTHTATFSDASMGMTRLRLAVEGAARKNIEQGLAEIGKLTL